MLYKEKKNNENKEGENAKKEKKKKKMMKMKKRWINNLSYVSPILLLKLQKIGEWLMNKYKHEHAHPHLSQITHATSFYNVTFGIGHGSYTIWRGDMKKMKMRGHR